MFIQDDFFDRSFSFVCAGVCCGFSASGCEGGAPASLGGYNQPPVKKTRVARRCSNKRPPSLCGSSPRARVLVLSPSLRSSP